VVTPGSDVPVFSVQGIAQQKFSSRLVLFDFDGTITTKDTLMELLRFYAGPRKLILGLLMLSPVLLKYLTGIMPNWKAKQEVLRWFLKGESVSLFNERCREFVGKVLPSLIRPKALAEIRRYQKEGAEVIVVSASAENWVRPWCETLGLTCVATRLEVNDGRLTGNISGKNCYGPEKVQRLHDCIDLKNATEIIAYGDSSGDKEMLALAHTSFYKPFRG
jgi:HAD superfamily hydrolase (TIGR01490 family)